MIIHLVTTYRRAKQGVHNPAGFANEEIQNVVLDAILLPGIIVALIIALLAVLGFTPWITEPILMARIFFWILLVIELFYFTVIIILLRLIARVIKKTEKYIHKKIHDFTK